MVLKYKVPKNQRATYENKKVIYCQIKKEIDLKLSVQKVYLVSMLNYNNLSTIFSSRELKPLNFFDKIILFFKY